MTLPLRSCFSKMGVGSFFGSEICSLAFAEMEVRQMNSYKTGFYVASAWLISVGIAYGVGWWAGVKSVAHAAVSAASTGFSLIPALILFVAVGSAIAAFQARGYFTHRE